MSCVAQAGLKLIIWLGMTLNYNPEFPTFTSRVLGLQACVTMPGLCAGDQIQALSKHFANRAVFLMTSISLITASALVPILHTLLFWAKFSNLSILAFVSDSHCELSKSIQGNSCHSRNVILLEIFSTKCTVSGNRQNENKFCAG